MGDLLIQMIEDVLHHNGYTVLEIVHLVGTVLEISREYNKEHIVDYIDDLIPVGFIE